MGWTIWTFGLSSLHIFVVLVRLLCFIEPDTMLIYANNSDILALYGSYFIVDFPFIPFLTFPYFCFYMLPCDF